MSTSKASGLIFHLRAVAGAQFAHIRTAAAALGAPEGEAAGAGKHDAEGNEHEENLKLVRTVAGGGPAGQKDGDKHFDPKEKREEARHNAHNERKAAQHLEPGDADADRARKPHVHKHAFDARDVAHLAPAVHQKDQPHRDADQKQPDRAMRELVTPAVDEFLHCRYMKG